MLSISDTQQEKNIPHCLLYRRIQGQLLQKIRTKNPPEGYTNPNRNTSDIFKNNPRS